MNKSIKEDKNKVKDRFAKKLVEYRKANGNLTQENLADFLKVNLSSVKSWETGRSLPGPDTLAVICVKLNCSYDYLLTGMNEKKHDDHTVCSITGLNEIASFILRSNQEIKQSKNCNVDRKEYIDRYAAVVSAVAMDKKLNSALAEYIYSLDNMEISFATSMEEQIPHIDINALEINGQKIDSDFIDAVRLQKIKSRLDAIKKEGDPH